MTEPTRIVQPPRAFQFVAFVQFPEDTRSDAQLSQYVLEQIGASFAIAQHVRGIAVTRIASIPAAGTPQ